MRLLLSIVVALPLLCSTANAQVTTRPTEGLHQAKPEWVLITGATVHVTGDRAIENCSVLIHGDKIVEVGANIQAPAGTRVVAGELKHVYPGFIDALLPLGTTESAATNNTYWNGNIRPDRSMAMSGNLADAKVSDRRQAGFTAALVAPNSGIVQGSSAIYLLSDEATSRSLLKADVALHLQLTTRFTFGERPAGGPNSPMGAYALARQTMIDAAWYRDAWQVARTNTSVERPEQNDSLALLQPVIDGSMPVVVGASNEIFVLRTARFAREFGLRLIVAGSGNEYRRIDEIAKLNLPIIIPVDFPDGPKVASPSDALNVSLEDLMHWDHAPENPARLAAAGVQFAFTANGLAKPADFLKQIRTAVKRGLDPAAALNAATSVPARMFGVDDQVGTVERGKYANLFITDGPLFEEKSKIVATLVAGELFEHSPEPARKFDGLWELETAGETGNLKLAITTDPKLSAKVFGSDAAETDEGTEVKSAATEDTRFSGSFDGKPLQKEGSVLLHMNIDVAEQGTGSILLPDGVLVPFTAKRTGDAPKPKRGEGGRKATEGKDGEAKGDGESKPEETKPAGDAEPADDKKADEKEGEDKGGDKKEAGPASYPVNYPFGDFGRTPMPERPASVLIRNVTVWTCGPQGIVENGNVLVENGRISRVTGPDEPLPEASLTIDGKGMHLTPGIIDCHSHMATDSGVNESVQAITAEVRIGDFIDCDDITIWRQLAGGVTSSNILHGSANPIGGQNQVIKLRWGLNDDQMKFAEAPQGIKFALGENVKRSNRSGGDTPERYPTSRMGVEQLMHDTFRAAREYQAKQDAWKTLKTGLPPRRDLELDAIAEILDGTRWIHCHSYRQDEILALIRVLDEYGITIGTFQHIMEGYKVADAIAKHGGMASAFSDWWAYKVEVYDAIPFGGAIMHNAGIVVSFNSDDGELARHLNHEAAKAVHFGGVPEEEALKFVTLNPAKQLRIDQYVGSIEAGKQADLVLWSGHPLALTSRCEQSWIDGRKYYDRAEAEKLAGEQATWKAALIQKILNSGGGTGGTGRERIDDSLFWPRYDEFCHGHEHEHGESDHE